MWTRGLLAVQMLQKCASNLLKSGAPPTEGTRDSKDARTFVVSIAQHQMGISVLLRREGLSFAQQLADEVIIPVCWSRNANERNLSGRKCETFLTLCDTRSNCLGETLIPQHVLSSECHL
jgi:hypothetical protein